MYFSTNKIIALFLIVFLFIGTIFAVLIINVEQNLKSKAEVSSTLSIQSQTINTNVSDNVEFDIVLNPGVNQVSFAKLSIVYDPQLLEPITEAPPPPSQGSSFEINTQAFPEIIDPPQFDNGKASVSIAANTLSPVSAPTIIAKLRFKIILNVPLTSGISFPLSTTLLFDENNQILSVGPNDAHGENVLQMTNEKTIFIQDPLISNNPSSTQIEANLYMHGIWPSGDSTKSENLFANKNPVFPNRNVSIEIFNPSSTNTPIVSSSGIVIYNPATGIFKGTIDLGTSLQTGTYSIKIKSPRYLKKTIPNTINITSGDTNILPVQTLTGGNIDNNEYIDIADFNILRDCGYFAANPLPLNDPNSLFNKPKCQSHPERQFADLDDNNLIDQNDYSLFIRNLFKQREN